MENSSVESAKMNAEAEFLNRKLNASELTDQIIIIDPNGETNILQENIPMQSYNEPEKDKSEKGVWQCNLELDGDYIESALSSSDESSPVKNNQTVNEHFTSDFGNSSLKNQSVIPDFSQEAPTQINLTSSQIEQCQPKQCSSKETAEENQEKQVKKVKVRKNYGRVKVGDEVSNVEDSASEVRKRFEKGCECAESCFRGLNPEAVYRHRLNIAELTKEEHDMYLMGVTMACMSDPVSTNKRRERRRARPNYAYSGRRVCLSAFLYLENVTLYQLKRIRKHVTIHGVTPRIHGNHGKKPHNVFSLDIYRRATYFLKNFIEQHNTSGNPKGQVVLPPDVTRKAVHDIYKDYVNNLPTSGEKILGYSTFRHFMKEQFPNLKFSKPDPGFIPGNVNKAVHSKQPIKTSRIEHANEQPDNVNQMKREVPPTDIQVSEIPVLITEPLKNCNSIIVTQLGHFIKSKDLNPPTFTFSTIS